MLARLICSETVKTANSTQTERDAGDRGQLLGEQVHERGGEQQQRDQSQADGNFHLADVEVARHLPFAVLRAR